MCCAQCAGDAPLRARPCNALPACPLRPCTPPCHAVHCCISEARGRAGLSALRSKSRSRCCTRPLVCADMTAPPRLAPQYARNTLTLMAQCSAVQCSAVQCSAVQCSAVHRVCNHPLPSGAVRFGTSCALQRAATCNRAACHRCNAAPSHRHVATGADHTCDGGQHCAAVRRRPSHDGCATTGGAERGGPNELRCGLSVRFWMPRLRHCRTVTP